jgi:hypothetical protein
VVARTAGALVGVGLLVATLATAERAQAAGDVVVSASPSEVVVGEPVEVLVRTFLVVEGSELSLPFEAPVEPYPVPSGVWNILYPWRDYPFDVVAQHEDETELRVPLARDPSDSTLWRGAISLPKAGAWTIWVRNFPGKAAGSTTLVTVGAPPAGSIGLGLAGLAGAVLGLIGGYAMARRRRSG